MLDHIISYGGHAHLCMHGSKEMDGLKGRDNLFDSSMNTDGRCVPDSSGGGPVVPNTLISLPSPVAASLM